MTAVESNAALLAKAHTQALECGVTINSISAANVHKKVAQAGGVASLVTIMHGIHLVDTDFALEECHRLLKPDGFLVLAWNDRCATLSKFAHVHHHACSSSQATYNCMQLSSRAMPHTCLVCCKAVGSCRVSVL